MMSDILNMLKRLKSNIAVFVFRQLDPFFPLRGGNICGTYKLKRLRNYSALYLFKTSLISTVDKKGQTCFFVLSLLQALIIIDSIPYLCKHSTVLACLGKS